MKDHDLACNEHRQRPRGVPRAAIGSVVAYMALPPLMLEQGVELLGIYNGQGFDLVVRNVLWIWLAACVIGVPWVNPLSLGRIYAIRAFRIIGFGGAAVHVALILVAAILALSPSVKAESPVVGPVACLVVLCALSPLSVIYVRTLLRVRWLDPRSRPDEWEPPASQRPI